MNAQAERQIAPWSKHGIRSKNDLDLTLVRESCFFFEIKNGIVHCDYHLTHLVFAQRAQKYHFFFNSVVAKYNVPNISFLLDVGDEAPEVESFPIFTFQRLTGSKNILLPDNDFIWTDCYSDEASWGIPDRVPFNEKRTSAAFVGSTTGGGHITAALLRSGGVPRVQAARFFRGSDLVDFRLPNIVQCDEEAANLLRAEGFGRDPSGWQEQLCHKFLISIDGNGATCSRVYISLVSNSALIKYYSDCEMFYFDMLVAGTHYIQVNDHAEVAEIVRTEAESPGKYKAVSEAGKEFALRYLTRDALESFTADLFNKYAASV